MQTVCPRLLERQDQVAQLHDQVAVGATRGRNPSVLRSERDFLCMSTRQRRHDLLLGLQLSCLQRPVDQRPTAVQLRSLNDTAEQFFRSAHDGIVESGTAGDSNNSGEEGEATVDGSDLPKNFADNRARVRDDNSTAGTIHDQSAAVPSVSRDEDLMALKALVGRVVAANAPMCMTLSSDATSRGPHGQRGGTSSTVGLLSGEGLSVDHATRKSVGPLAPAHSLESHEHTDDPESSSSRRTSCGVKEVLIGIGLSLLLAAGFLGFCSLSSVVSGRRPYVGETSSSPTNEASDPPDANIGGIIETAPVSFLQPSSTSPPHQPSSTLPPGPASPPGAVWSRNPPTGPHGHAPPQGRTTQPNVAGPIPQIATLPQSNVPGNASQSNAASFSTAPPPCLELEPLRPARDTEAEPLPPAAPVRAAHHATTNITQERRSPVPQSTSAPVGNPPPRLVLPTHCMVHPMHWKSECFEQRLWPEQALTNDDYGYLDFWRNNAGICNATPVPMPPWGHIAWGTMPAPMPPPPHKNVTPQEDILQTHKQLLADITQALRDIVDITIASGYCNPACLLLTRPVLPHDKDAALAVVAWNGLALQFGSGELRSDQGVVLAAVVENGYAFEFAAGELKSDKGFVLQAVAQNGHALRFAADELRSDREVVLAAVSTVGCAFEHASDELKHNTAFCLEVLVHNQSAYLFIYPFVSDGVKKDPKFIRATAEQTGWAAVVAKCGLCGGGGSCCMTGCH